jgi:DNA-binding response OmpR family regulator
VKDRNTHVVLVVDDDRDIAESIADVLRASGYHAEIAEDGRSALKITTQRRVSLVLLDWRLPDGPAGAVLVRELRDAGGASLPVVVLSADPVSLAEARAAQASDYLPKPFDVADLMHLVHSYCA